MPKCTMYIGLDVHKSSIDVALAASDQSEVRPYGRIAGDLDAVDRVVRKLRVRHPRLDFVYEAGQPLRLRALPSSDEEGISLHRCGAEHDPEALGRPHQDGPARRDRAGPALPRG